MVLNGLRKGGAKLTGMHWAETDGEGRAESGFISSGLDWDCAQGLDGD